MVSDGNQVDCMHQVPDYEPSAAQRCTLIALSLLLLQFWKAAATAVALKRIIILPKFLCFCDELWMYALEDKEDVKCKYADGVLQCSDTAADLLTTMPWRICQGGVRSPMTLWGCLWPAKGWCTTSAHCTLTICSTPGTGARQMSKSADNVSCHSSEVLSLCRLPGNDS